MERIEIRTVEAGIETSLPIPAPLNRKSLLMQAIGKRQPLRSHHHPRRGGFTLLEMMAAMTVLVVGVMGVFTLLITAMQTDSESSHYAIARTFAQEELESIRTLRTTEIAGSTIPNCSTTLSVLSQGTVRAAGNGTSLTAPSGLPAATAQVWVVTQSTSSLATLDWAVVQVTWTEPGRGTTTILVDTYICDSGISTHI